MFDIQTRALLLIKFQVESNISFKSEGNRIQFRFNEEILDGLHKLHKLIPSTDKSAYVAIDLITKLRERNKLMRIADNSAGGDYCCWLKS
jgi:hypothetical protein